MCSVWILLNFRSFSCCFFDLKRINARKKGQPLKEKWHGCLAHNWLKNEIWNLFQKQQHSLQSKKRIWKNFAARIKILGIGFME